MKKILLTLVLVLIGSATLMAQHRLKRKGDAQYEQLSYQLAIPYYERYLKRTEDGDATQKLADCFRLTNNYPKATEWYAKVMQLPAQPAITHFHYGHCLLQEGRIEEAQAEFQTYAELMPDDPRGKAYKMALDRYDILFRDSIRVSIFHPGFNTPDAEFGGFPYLDGFVLAAARDLGSPVIQEFDWLDKPFLDLYYIAYKEDSLKYAKAEKLLGDVNTRYHESNFTMADGASECYFTRNNFHEKKQGKSDAGITLLKIYKAKITGLETSDVEEFAYNSDNYSVTHPSISADGQTLYFVSDMPGGEGGKDIYLCRKQGDAWTQPENVRQANTQGDEMFPFIHPDGTLYFSSDGHPGLGHLDIFYLKSGTESVPVNMGFPLNSAYDDFSLWVNRANTEGYLSSDREGGAGGDDLYHFRLKKPTLELIVMDSVAQLPLENAKVTVLDLTDNSLYEYSTDSSGMRLWPTEFGHAFKVKVEAPEFRTREIVLNTDIGKGSMAFSYKVQLYSPPPAFTGIVIDDSTLQTLPGATVEFVNLREKSSDMRTADRNGRFHYKLKPNSLYEINARQKGYLTYTERISTSLSAYEGDTVIPLKMERIPFNKPILLKNIHYDFDKWTIRYDAYNDLIFVANLMKKNPTLIVELGSHTDCRGSDAYNEKLSQKRANSARYFIIDLGIDPARIVAKGYGETVLSNPCDDGVPCSEDQHYANRRTEFKIIGEIEGIDMNNSVLQTQEGKAPAPQYVPESPAPEPPKAIVPAPTPLKQFAPGESEELDNAKVQRPVPTNAAVVAPVVPAPAPVAVMPAPAPAPAPALAISSEPVKPSAMPAPSPSTAPKAATFLGDSPSGNAEGYQLPDFKHGASGNIAQGATVFRVKIGAFAGTLSPAAVDRLKAFKSFTFYLPDNNGMNAYYLGEYLNYANVSKALEQVKGCGYYGAYVTAFKEGKELSFGELRELMAK